MNKTFAYIATDEQGRTVTGTVAAVDWPAAVALLTARGMSGCRQATAGAATVNPGLGDAAIEAFPALGPADALELASHLSQLTKAELPLGAALRAAAKDLPSGPLPQAMRALAARLDAGQPLDSALESLAARLPAHLGNVVIAGVRSGRLAPTLEAILAHGRRMDDLTRQFREATIYPVVVLAMLVAWLLFAALWLVPAMQIGSLFKDFGAQSRSADRLNEFAEVVPPLVMATLIATLAIVTMTRLFGGAGAVSRLVAQLPLLGPAWWYRGLVEFCGLLGLFLEQQLPLGDALRLVSATARDPAVAAACRKAAVDVEAGSDLASCLDRNAFFPPTLSCLVRWGQDNSTLGDALAGARQIYSDRFELQTQLVRLIFPPIIFFVVAGGVLFVAESIYGTLVQLIVDLTSMASPSRPILFGSIQLSGIASLLVIGGSLLFAARVLKTITLESHASRRLLSYTGFVLIAIGLLGGCLVTAGPAGMIAWLIVMAFWLRGAMNFRATQRRNLLAALALAVKKQMPLAPLATAFAQEQEGGFARRAEALARILEQGNSLTDAVSRSPAALPPEAALVAHLAAESGDLAGSLVAANYNHDFDRALLRPVMLRLLYVFPVMILFLAFMKIKIEPSMAKIFWDFDIPLPPTTRAVIGWPGGYVVEIFFGLVLVMFVMAVLAWLQWRGTLAPRLPGLKRTINWVDMGVALRVLALAARLNRPLPSMLHAIARFHPKRSVRQRMHAVVRDTNDGRSWQESLRRQRLLSAADAAILAAAERSRNLPWALVEMAESFERRATHRLQALSQVVLPLLLLPLGICVLLLAVAYFQPLPLLIESLS